MSDTDKSVFWSKRFYPLFFTQFLGAFNDNFFKNVVVFALVYQALELYSGEPEIIITAAAGIFILPFFLFSAVAGQLADKYPKDTIIKYIKLAEIGIAVLGVIGLYTSSLGLLIVVLFLFGAQSAFFSPSKFSILPQHLKPEELVKGNGYLSAGSNIAILAGTIIGGLMITVPGYGLHLTAVLMVLIAVTGYASSVLIPAAPAPSPKLKIDYNFVTETWNAMKYAAEQKRGVWLSILGIAWFYFLGAVFLAQFPVFAKENLLADETVLALFLTLFSVGVALGSLLNDKLLGGRVEATYVPFAAIGIAFFALNFSLIDPPSALNDATLRDIPTFLSDWQGWMICLDLFAMAFFGGLFVVPLYAVVQHYTEEEHRARVIASSNIIDALAMVFASVFAGFMLYIGAGIDDIFFVVSLAGVGVAAYTCKILPAEFIKSFMQGLLKLLYKVEVKGMENLEKAGPRAVIVCNHVSFLDAPVLAAYLPGKPMFALHTEVAKWWWLKPFLKMIDAFPLDPANPHSIKNLIKEVRKDKHCVIFPEGRLTETGALMKIYEGPGMIADKSDAMVVPIRLDGVQHSPFSRLKGKVPIFTFPKITMTILEPREFNVPEDAMGRTRRQIAGRQLHDVMESMMFMTEDREQTLYQALLSAVHVNGGKSIVAEDPEFKPLPYKRLVTGSIVLGDKIANRTEKGENVGVLLPNSVGAIVTFFALQAYGRVPAMLNFSAGPKAVVSACETAKLKTVLTSRRFIELGRLEELEEAIGKVANIVYLEDIKKQVDAFDKIAGLMKTSLAKYLHDRQDVKPDDPAVILFTSGSEGAPKGVVLSHKNLMTNVVQLSVRVDFNRQDTVFNCLPMFHSFGLTGGTILPILSGVKTFLYPSPLHFRIVPEMVYHSNATIMFGTDTFLNGYARVAHPYDFYRMRYIFAGAEKVKEETRQKYMDLFGVRILEGYGATESSPVIAVNSPMHQKAGTVGRFLAGLEHKLEDVPGVDEGGRLFVRGPNVMLGYLKADKPGVLQPPEEGWHDTGDIMDIDDNGFVAIKGRAKRFAKIAGEMVSLTIAETLAKKAYPEADHAVVAIPDAKKGEQLVLVTTDKAVEKSALSAQANKDGVTELGVPKNIMHMEKLPVLGTGKTDYVTLQKHVDAEMGVKKAA